jgi:hypothetical protein
MYNLLSHLVTKKNHKLAILGVMADIRIQNLQNTSTESSWVE